MAETWLREMPVIPIDCTKASTFRVETPFIQASWITALRAFSDSLRASKKGGKYVPSRSLGMRRSNVPRRVLN